MARHRNVPRLVPAALIALAVACAPSPADESRSAVGRDATGASTAPASARPDAAHDAAAPDDRIPPQAAYLVLDRRGAAIASQRDDVLDTPMLAGSVMKPVALLAARDAGLIDASTRIECTRLLRIEGRVLDCVHPALGRALGPADALAHSCNAFVVRVSARLSRSALSGAAVAIGLPPVPASASLELAAIGLDGARATPRRWLAAFRTLVEREQQREGPSFILDGLRDAARTGSAAALGEGGLDVLAKTGTAPMPGGGTAGLVVAVTPDRSRAIIVVAPGGSGRDAAEIATRVLRRHDARDGARIRLGMVRGGRYEVRSLSMHDYVAGVVDAEAPPDATPAFRRVLAIAARTWATRNAGRHAAEGFDVCDLTHCQAFRPSRATGRDAASDTHGIVLRDRAGALVDAEYSASCGGRLEGGADPAGVEHPDGWRADLDHRALRAAIAPLGVTGGAIDRIAVVARTASGRARTLVVHTDRAHEIDAEQFRLAVGRALGWQHLKSTWFDVEPYSRGFVFTGRGHGHGRGLCVHGAAAMSARGDTVERVLQAYFPAAAASADASDVTITVRTPASIAHRRPALAMQVGRDAAALAVRLGRGLPASIALEVHPTIESFQRATGMGWWVSARVRGDRIDVIPIDLLERRGRLDVTLRHELVHVLTADRLADRPRWVHEGLAVVMARETVRAATSAGACPADEEFARATADTLPLLYARAAACVTRELATHAWVDAGAGSAR